MHIIIKDILYIINIYENAKKHFIPLKKIKYQLYEHIEFFIGIKLFIGHTENTTNSTIKDMKYYYDRIKVHHATYSHHINRKKRNLKKNIGYIIILYLFNKSILLIFLILSFSTVLTNSIFLFFFNKSTNSIFLFLLIYFNIR